MYTKTESEVSVQNKMGGVSEKQNLENKVILKLYIYRKHKKESAKQFRLFFKSFLSKILCFYEYVIRGVRG